MSTKKTALVTGANRGLGLETAKQLAKKGYRVILTARAVEKGAQEAGKLKDAGFDVTFLPLDVTDADSIERVARHVRESESNLDVLVNNAGVALDSWGDKDGSVLHVPLERVRETFEINTLGPLRLIQALVPYMHGGGCIVNVSSGMGQLSDMEGGTASYRISKTALNAVTKIAAAELADSHIKVNAVCPGWVRTDMGGPNAERSVEEGAAGIVYLATLPEDGPTGGYFRDNKKIPW